MQKSIKYVKVYSHKLIYTMNQELPPKVYTRLHTVIDEREKEKIKKSGIQVGTELVNRTIRLHFTRRDPFACVDREMWAHAKQSSPAMRTWLFINAYFRLFYESLPLLLVAQVWGIRIAHTHKFNGQNQWLWQVQCEHTKKRELKHDN